MQSVPGLLASIVGPEFFSISYCCFQPISISLCRLLLVSQPNLLAIQQFTGSGWSATPLRPIKQNGFRKGNVKYSQTQTFLLFPFVLIFFLSRYLISSTWHLSWKSKILAKPSSSSLSSSSSSSLSSSSSSSLSSSSSSSSS